KRLTIAVELVANPSIISTDEPTSGLDAGAAAIVMHTTQNTVDAGRTVVCTIHQPSIDIFEAFDDLLLMKRGGQVIYAGSLGRHSHKLIEYFEAVPGVLKINDGYNPATWMLEISSTVVEAQLYVDFAEIYANSDLYRRNQELIKEQVHQCLDLRTFISLLSIPNVSLLNAKPASGDSSAHTGEIHNTMPSDSSSQLLSASCLYRAESQDLMNLLGAMYSAVLFLGTTNTSAVQPIVAIERTVLYIERAAGMYSPLPYAFSQGKEGCNRGNLRLN
ncbi:hypothetical protein SLEP1_g60465, partial [Rubroshorea leprosula]